MEGPRYRFPDLRTPDGERIELRVEGGILTFLGRQAGSPAGTWTEIDGKGAVVLPAFVDLCGFPARSGRSDLLRAEAETARRCGIGTLVSLDPGQKTGLPGIPASQPLSAGEGIVTDLGSPLSPPALFDALRRCADRGALVLLDGRDVRFGTSYHPLAERIGVSEKLLLAEAAGCAVHFPLLSTRGGIEAVRAAKEHGQKVTCGTSPLYLACTGNDAYLVGSRAKLSPPLGTEDDRQALLGAAEDGSLDYLVSAHVSLSDSDKLLSPEKAKPGAIGYQTLFGAAMSLLVESGRIPFSCLIRLLSEAPGRVLGMDTALAVGKPAAFTLVAPHEEWTVRAGTLPGRSTQTPLLGMTLNGRVKGCFADGGWTPS